MFNFDAEKRFEKRERRSENDPKRDRKLVNPPPGLLKCFTGTSLKVFRRPNFAKNQICFTARICRDGHTKNSANVILISGMLAKASWGRKPLAVVTATAWCTQLPAASLSPSQSAGNRRKLSIYLHCSGLLSKMEQARELRHGWPATEWETGPEPKMAEKRPVKWPAAIFQGRWRKIGQTNGRTGRKSPNFSRPAFCLAMFRPTPPKNDRRPFRRPFLGHSWLWARFPHCSRPARSQPENRCGRYCFASFFLYVRTYHRVDEAGVSL